MIVMKIKAQKSGSMKTPSIEKAKKACENKEKNSCITAVSMLLGNKNSNADELKEAYKLTQIGCDINAQEKLICDEPQSSQCKSFFIQAV